MDLARLPEPDRLPAGAADIRPARTRPAPAAPDPRPRRTALLLLGIVGLALAERLGSIDASLWLDEAFTYWFATRPLDYLWRVVPTFETHPPAYATIVKLFLLAGESEAWLRLPSLLASLATLPLVFLITRRQGGGGTAGVQAGLAAALLMALSPAQAQFAQDARPYALLVLAFAVFLAGGLRRLAVAEAGGAAARLTWRDLVFVLAGAMTVWLHAVGTLFVGAVFAVLGAHGLVRLAAGDARPLRDAVLLGLGVLVLYLPDAWNLLDRTEEWRSTWMSPLTAYRARAVVERLLAVRPITGDSPLGLVLVAGLGGLALAGLWQVARRSGAWAAAMLVAAILVPVALAVGFSLAQGPIFALRTMLGVTVPIAVLVAIGALSVPRPALRHAVLGVLFGLSALSAWYGTDVPPEEDWRGAIATLIAERQPGEPVVAVPAESGIGAYYYLRRAGHPFPLREVPAPYPAMGLPNPYPVGSPAMPGLLPGDVDVVMAETRNAPRVWLLSRVDEFHDPDCRMPRALAAARQPAMDQAFGRVRLRRYDAPWPDGTAPPPTACP